MQQEQASALDKQLSTQAYYAAESGINDAIKAINDGYTGDKNECGNTTTDLSNAGATGAALTDLSDNTVGGSSSPTAASYPCLLIDTTPPNLEYNPISITAAKVAELEGIDPTTHDPEAIKSMTISWQDPDKAADFASAADCSQSASTASTFSPLATWNATGLLRFELIPINSLDRNSLINNEFTAFLCPSSGDGTFSTVAYAPGLASGNGPIVSGKCNSVSNTGTSLEPDYCNVQISGLGTGSLTNESTYFIAMQSIYNPTSVVVSAYDGDGTPNTTNQLDMKDAQTLIDSTGKAQNVLRRIQVRISSQNGYDLPSGTHAADDLCKQLQVAPGSTVTPPDYCTITP
ncbi:unnamed protein product [Sphagnum balticum]